MRTVKIGSRGSKLALWQTEAVAEELRRLHPGLNIKIEIIKTKGDKILDVALSRIGDKGLFTREIEQEILLGRIDMAVHSMKDMPTVVPEGLAFGAVMKREDPSDVLISPSGLRLNELAPNSVVGTSSLRRRAQTMQVRSDLKIIDLRGNIDTRIKRVTDGEMDAIILAAAGVKRLGYDHLITENLGFLPAVGQGAIVVEVRESDEAIFDLLKDLDDQETRLTIAAERSFLAALEGGCQIPIGALAKIVGQELVLEGMVSDLKGNPVYRQSVTADASKPVEAGRCLAESLLKCGAGEVLERIRSQGNSA